MDDNAILDLFRERSEDAIVQVQIKYGNYCRSIAYGILSSEEDSEECVNDTYMRAWNSIPPHIPERLSAYLGKITRNLSIDRLRRKGTGKRGGGQFEVALSELEECLPSPSAAGTEEAADSAALSEIINRFLRTLSLEKRTVFYREVLEHAQRIRYCIGAVHIRGKGEIDPAPPAGGAACRA